MDGVLFEQNKNNIPNTQHNNTSEERRSLDPEGPQSSGLALDNEPKGLLAAQLSLAKGAKDLLIKSYVINPRSEVAEKISKLIDYITELEIKNISKKKEELEEEFKTERKKEENQIPDLQFRVMGRL